MRLGHPAKGGEGAKIRYGLPWKPRKKKIVVNKTGERRKHNISAAQKARAAMRKAYR